MSLFVSKLFNMNNKKKKICNQVGSMFSNNHKKGAG